MRKKIMNPIGEMCRLCGESGKAYMTNIFDNELDVLEKINMFIPIIILQHDELPKKICSTCSNHLKIATDLIKKSCMTDNKIKGLYQTSKRCKINNLTINGPIICDICNIEFINMDNFDDHIAIHKDVPEETTIETGTLINICSDCGLAYIENDKYLNHKLIKEKSCEKCGVQVLSDCSFLNHFCKKTLDVKTTVREKQKDAKIQSKAVVPLKDENNRTVVKTEQNCSGDTSTKDNSKINKDSAIKFGVYKRFFQCNFCHKVVTTKLGLLVHERIHSGMKPYICEHCGFGFRSRANLMQHQSVHTGIRKYSCPICAKKFARKSFVRTHMRVHTGEKPFSCDICNYRFSQAGDMRRHRKRHLIVRSKS